MHVFAAKACVLTTWMGLLTYCCPPAEPLPTTGMQSRAQIFDAVVPDACPVAQLT